MASVFLPQQVPACAGPTSSRRMQEENSNIVGEITFDEDTCCRLFGYSAMVSYITNTGRKDTTLYLEETGVSLCPPYTPAGPKTYSSDSIWAVCSGGSFIAVGVSTGRTRINGSGGVINSSIKISGSIFGTVVFSGTYSGTTTGSASGTLSGALTGTFSMTWDSENNVTASWSISSPTGVTITGWDGFAGINNTLHPFEFGWTLDFAGIVDAGGTQQTKWVITFPNDPAPISGDPWVTADLEFTVDGPGGGTVTVLGVDITTQVGLNLAANGVNGIRNQIIAMAGWVAGQVGAIATLTTEGVRSITVVFFSDPPPSLTVVTFTCSTSVGGGISGTLTGSGAILGGSQDFMATGIISGTVSGTITIEGGGPSGSLTGTVTGDLTGTLTGTITGSFGVPGVLSLSLDITSPVTATLTATADVIFDTLLAYHFENGAISEDAGETGTPILSGPIITGQLGDAVEMYMLLTVSDCIREGISLEFCRVSDDIVLAGYTNFTHALYNGRTILTLGSKICTDSCGYRYYGSGLQGWVNHLCLQIGLTSVHCGDALLATEYTITIANDGTNIGETAANGATWKGIYYPSNQGPATRWILPPGWQAQHGPNTSFSGSFSVTGVLASDGVTPATFEVTVPPEASAVNGVIFFTGLNGCNIIQSGSDLVSAYGIDSGGGAGFFVSSITVTIGSDPPFTINNINLVWGLHAEYRWTAPVGSFSDCGNRVHIKTLERVALSYVGGTVVSETANMAPSEIVVSNSGIAYTDIHH